MPVLSLLELARKECIQNIKKITDVGTLEYQKVRPLLLKLDRPEQLRDIEKASPQIIGHDEEIWIQFIKRDASGWEQKSLSRPNGHLCYETYVEAVIQSKKEIAYDEQILKATMDKIKTQQLEHTSRQVDARTVPKLPKLGGMQYLSQLKYVDGDDEWRYVQPRKPRKVPEPKTELVFGVGSRMKITNGRALINKARKEAEEQRLIRSRLSIPTHKLQQSASQVQHVALSLALDHVRPAVPQRIDPTIKPAEVFVPPKKRVRPEELTASEPSSANDEERPIKKAKTTTTGVASSDQAEKASSMHPLALANQLPQTQPAIPASNPIRPMKAKRPVDIFIRPKRR